jgi:uncharacterized coiled-coil protein SlyX
LPRGAVAAATQNTVTASTVAAGGSEIQVLSDKVTSMQAEIDRLKQQMAQVMNFLQQRRN